MLPGCLHDSTNFLKHVEAIRVSDLFAPSNQVVASPDHGWGLSRSGFDFWDMDFLTTPTFDAPSPGLELTYSGLPIL